MPRPATHGAVIQPPKSVVDRENPGVPQDESSFPEGKSIILLSDGTGNSSAKVFKTNVWRMYEAIDLGPSPSGIRDQISFYDDGVGTSNFKLLAAIGGIFGWGLKRNVLDLYRFACRNYRKGDRIYAFGFSRGAFTIRLVTELIASQGLVSSTDESDLERKSLEAYRAFRRAFRPRKFGFATDSARTMRDFKSTYQRNDNLDPTISFVGVWDTVAAYGGPIAEITRAIDNWIYRLSMPDYELHENVERARHALAIDDERDAFWPLLWDEVAEERRAKEAAAFRLQAEKNARQSTAEDARQQYQAEAKRFDEREKRFRTRLQQVWFTGMHADVGGGYPDESLSYVSLLWMMKEAEDAGLRTLASVKDRYFALANSYGPMHDSRSGIGAYYRYQPRKIAVWLDWANAKDSDRYLMLRDPDVVDQANKSRGLLRTVKVHESVIARISSGTVRYAPIALPARFAVVPPQDEGENVRQDTNTTTLKFKYDRPPSEPLITPAIRELAERDAKKRFRCQEDLFDLVYERRIFYFLTVLVTSLLIALPLGNPVPSIIDRSCSDARCLLPTLFRPLKVVLPGFAEPWIDAISAYPVTPLILGTMIFFLLRRSSRLDRQIRDRSFHLWRKTLDDQRIRTCPQTRLRAFREGVRYQKFFRRLRWQWLPTLVGLLVLGALLYIPYVLLTQAMIWVAEASHGYCPPEDPRRLRAFERAEFLFNTQSPCRSPQLKLEKGQMYEIVFQLPVTGKGEPVGWWDKDYESEPGALTQVSASGPLSFLGVPMRRVITEPYLKPLIETAPLDNESQFGLVNITALNLRPDEEWPELYRARFRASKRFESSLHLFANDAYIPLLGKRMTYANNCGNARVFITKITHRGTGRKPMEHPEMPPPIADCARKKLNMPQSAEDSAPVAS